MIRYSITNADLRARIDTLDPGWMAEARKKTDDCKQAGRFLDEGNIWSRIKQIYMDLQGGKCGYCERRFSTGAASKIEHDVEHFRPKSSIKAWPATGSKLSYPFSTGGANTSGYYLLAYEPGNYLASCKKCNSTYKGSYFPIGAATRQVTAGLSDSLKKEKAFLIYPIGSDDADPESLIGFTGLLPFPAKSSGEGMRCARVTIDFFDLALREELLRERAEVVMTVYVAYQDRNHRSRARREAARLTLEQLGSPRLKHRNCARCFYRLCESDLSGATAQFEAATAYLRSVDG